MKINIKKHIIGTKDIETIQTREKCKILGIRIENDRSLPEIHLLEDESTKEVQKHFLIAQENFRILYDFDELEVIGYYTIRNNLHVFWVFEIKSDYIKRISEPIRIIEDVEININRPIIQDVIKKWTRLPKPNLDKNYTKDELESMHPERQLKYILNKKYNLKGRVANKLSLENQIQYILSIQNGEDCSAEELLNSQYSNKTFEGISRLIYKDDSTDIISSEGIVLVFYSNNDPQII